MIAESIQEQVRATWQHAAPVINDFLTTLPNTPQGLRIARNISPEMVVDLFTNPNAYRHKLLHYDWWYLVGQIRKIQHLPFLKEAILNSSIQGNLKLKFNDNTDQQ